MPNTNENYLPNRFSSQSNLQTNDFQKFNNTIREKFSKIKIKQI